MPTTLITDARLDEDRTEAATGGPTDTRWLAPAAAGPLNARIMLPGSKSLTNRELVLSALADAPSLLRRPLHSRDTRLMVEALRSLGVDIEEVDGDGAYSSLRPTSSRDPCRSTAGWPAR